MEKYRYTGTFIADNRHTYTLSVNCNGFIQAFILLTAEAIKNGYHYQLDTILDEKGNEAQVSSINELSKILN